MNNNAVWKYVLKPGKSTFEMSKGAKVISAQAQGDEVCVWAVVNHDETHKEQRHFISIATGQIFNHTPNLAFIGTVQMVTRGTVLQFHIFEVKAEDAT